MRLKLAFGILCVAGFLAPCISFAADYPVRPIRYVIGTGLGSVSDLSSRAFADKASQRLRQPVVVETRPGGGGIVGMNAAFSAEPDGYTVFGSSSGTMSGPALMKTFPYDLNKDVILITVTVRGRVATVVNASSPIRNMADLVTYMRANPGKVNFGSSQASDLLQLSLLRRVTGTKFEVINYSGSVQIATAIAAGEIQAALGGAIPVSKPLVDAGKLRFIAVTAADRDQLIPDVPSLGESALPEVRELAQSALYSPFWLGPMVSSKVPRDIVNVLYLATAEVMKDAEYIKRMRDVGLEVLPTAQTPDEATAMLMKGAAEFIRIGREAGIPPQ